MIGRFVRRGGAAEIPGAHEALSAMIERSRRQLRDESTVVEALVRMGEAEVAAHAIEDQRIAFGTLRAQLEALVGDTLTERVQGAQRYPERFSGKGLRARVSGDPRLALGGRGARR